MGGANYSFGFDVKSLEFCRIVSFDHDADLRGEMGGMRQGDSLRCFVDIKHR